MRSYHCPARFHLPRHLAAISAAIVIVVAFIGCARGDPSTQDSLHDGVGPGSISAVLAELREKPRPPLQDSSVQVIEYVPACPQCRIEFVSIAVLGRTTDSISPANVHTDIARDSRGNFYTWSFDRRAILKYDAAGDIVGAVARGGEGPGEISGNGTRLVIGAGDTLYAFWRGSALVLDTAGQVIRTMRLPGGIFGPPVLLSGGRVLMSASLPAPATAGLGIHLLSASGDLLGSFGGDGSYDARCLQCQRFVLAPSLDTALVWIVPPNRYELMRSDIHGRTHSSIHVKGSWFVPSADSLRPELPVHFIRQDDDGLLWVFNIIRPSSSLRSSKGVAIASDTLREAIRSQVRTVVDVFDPVSGNLIATGEFAGAYLAFGRDYAVQNGQTTDGNVRVEVFRARLFSR